MDDHSSVPVGNSIPTLFRKLWPIATHDSNLTLHGFRRFKTAQLLNLRFLEEEIAEIDYSIYQAGLQVAKASSNRDRLGLETTFIDPHAPTIEEGITSARILKLRTLFRDYNESLASFSNVMGMETISGLDLLADLNELPQNMTLRDMHKTRLVRIDVGPRSRTDYIHRWIHKQLRSLRYWEMRKAADALNSGEKPLKGVWAPQNSVLISNILGQAVAVSIVGFFLITPLALLSDEKLRGKQLAVVCAFIAGFTIIVGATLRVTSFEVMAASAAYAAVVVVFMSSG